MTRWLPLAAAASIAVVAIALNGRVGTTEAPVLRGTDTPFAIQTVAPADHGAVDLPARFTWLRAPDALEYRVTITNAAGEIASERVTADTTAVFVALPPATYRWNVTAILGSGSVISSGMHEFTLR